MVKSVRHGLHFGSLIARNIIDEFQPLVCIGGHMHEHFVSCSVEKTLVINSGFGNQVNVYVELEGNHGKEVHFNKGGIVTEKYHFG